MLRALDAALEVNEHLRQQVEEKGSLALSLGTQMEASEHRYQKLLDRTHSMEKRLAAMAAGDDATEREV